MAFWFFFSYARQDRDERLDRFYQDLTKNVRLAKQLNENETAFFDQRSIEVGDVWTETLREALRTTRVLVCICSPTYLSREYCGKELQFCINRVPVGAKATAIFPVIWGMPSASQHAAFQKYQFTHDDLTEIYKIEGLYYMMGLTRHADDYAQFVTKLARMIVDAGQNRPLKDSARGPLFDRVDNPFKTAPRGSGSTLKHAIFSYVAASKSELPKPNGSGRYGDDGKEWRPFYPDCSDPVGIMAQEVAAKQKLFYQDLPLDSRLVERVREAEENKQVVILVVDPWSVQVKTYEQYMRSYDKNNFDNSAVLVAWNSADGTSGARLRKLKKHLSETFRHHSGGKENIYYVDSIFSDRDFRNTMAKTIAKLRNNLIQTSGIHGGIDAPDLARRARRAGIPIAKQPIVAGPGDREG